MASTASGNLNKNPWHVKANHAISVWFFFWFVLHNA